MMKIWNGDITGKDYAIVVAKSQKRACQLLSECIPNTTVTLHTLTTYFSQAGGKYEDTLLKDNKECVWYWKDRRTENKGEQPDIKYEVPII